MPDCSKKYKDAEQLKDTGKKMTGHSRYPHDIRHVAEKPRVMGITAKERQFECWE